VRHLATSYKDRIDAAIKDSLVFGTGWIRMVGPDTPFNRTYQGADEQGRIRVVDTFYDQKPRQP
jgi:hypothetical protein